MLKEKVWRWEHDGGQWELSVQFDGDNRSICVYSDDEEAANVLVSKAGVAPDPPVRRYEPWPEEVLWRFEKAVRTARRAVQLNEAVRAKRKELWR